MRTLQNHQNVGLFEWLIGILFIILFVLMFGSAANAQDTFTVQCAHLYDSSYAAENLIPRYDETSGGITLETLTGETYRVLDSGVQTQSTLRYQWWSPDCRYFASTLDEGVGNALIVWDTLEGHRVGAFTGLPDDAVLALYWSPDGQYILVNSTVRSELWQPATGTRVYMGISMGDGDIAWDMVQWDMVRGEVWRLRHYSYITSDPGVTVYNFAGEIVGYYNNSAGIDQASGFRLSDDGNHVIVYTVQMRGYRSAGITIWQRGTSANVQVDADVETILMPERINLSPDGRYLVSAQETLRVWDLQNLSADFEARNPSISEDLAHSFAVRFVDNTTVEMDGVMLNVATGVVVGRAV